MQIAPLDAGAAATVVTTSYLAIPVAKVVAGTRPRRP